MGGYASRLAVFDAMLFYLPPFSSITTRTMQLKDMFLELWSPNSSCQAYYPRVSDRTVLGIGLEPPKRQCDSHLGRFDYMISPQHFDKERPWLGFIKKKHFDATPENVLILEVWTPVSFPNYSQFQPNFVSIMLDRASLLDLPPARFPQRFLFFRATCFTDIKLIPRCSARDDSIRFPE